ncbi:MAG: alpha/beta fold hydrolase [Gammaproteobacteria bacterium]
MTPTTVAAADGYKLAATRFDAGDGAVATVLIGGAMGVAQKYYAPFAQWLAARGYTTLTFDYRGIAKSAPASLRGFDATVTDWTALDCAAMVDVAAADGRLVIWLGHSLGGQILPMVPNAHKISRMLMVAAGNGHWRYHEPRMMLTAALLWFVIAPTAIAAAGYFPGRRLRMVGDLPAGVMRQWRSWCLHPRYCVGVEGLEAEYAAFTAPVHALSFADDEFMSARNTDELYALYTNAPIDATRLAPSDVGLTRIGHFGFFRAENSGTLWPRLLGGFQ